MSSCLQVTITMLPMQAIVTASIFCGAGLSYVPLLVDEGYLLIDFKDKTSYIYVKSK